MTGRVLKKNQQQNLVLFPDKEKEYSKLIEGAWVDYHDGKYYLYYSGDNCCGDKANYAVMVARADNAFGPFRRLWEQSKWKQQTVLSWKKIQTWFAPGHNSIVKDNKGNSVDCLSCHLAQ